MSILPVSSNISLKGHVAIVSGGARGIGAAAAVAKRLVGEAAQPPKNPLIAARGPLVASLGRSNSKGAAPCICLGGTVG